MTIFLTIIGAIVVLAIFIALAACACGFAMSQINEWLYRRDNAVREAYRHRWSDIMRGQAYWFSEHPEIQSLIEACADTIKQDDGISQWRGAFERRERERQAAANGGAPA